jgi:hypothetical protein
MLKTAYLNDTDLQELPIQLSVLSLYELVTSSSHS